MRKRILFDMDGVLVDFSKAVRQLTKAQGLPDVDQSSWDLFPDARYDAVERTVSTNALWWERLPSIPAGVQAFKTLFSDAALSQHIYVCSSPTYPISATPKLTWCRDKLGLFASGVILCKRKFLLAGPSSVLIDDRADLCNSFVSNGGTAILVNQPWSFSRMNGNSLDSSIYTVRVENLSDLISELRNESII